MADNRLLRQDIPSSLGDALYQTGRNALLYPFRNPEAMAEFGLGMAPGSGEAMSARDAWNASGEAGNALMGGNYRDAAAQYGNMATGILGALPGAGIIARGTKRGAAWMDRNLPAGVNKLLDAATPSNMQDVAPAFPAWHGSPHDFDEFKLDKIGTGEGAQAYGHGLYFAENPNVAKAYREKLTSSQVKPDAEALAINLVKEAEKNGNKDPYGYAKYHLDMWREDRLAAHRRLGNAEDVATKIAKTESDYATASAFLENKGVNTGRLYKAEIDAEPHQLLDWDKPFSEQGEVGAKAMTVLEKLGYSASPNRTMADIKQLAKERYGGMSPEQTSKALREAGIPGIRYLDQGSRGADGGTSNYVIFDDKLTKILSKE